LADDDVIQETRSGNTKLDEFLNEERIEMMIRYITEEPPDPNDT
jgi:hypothetical protein